MNGQGQTNRLDFRQRAALTLLSDEQRQWLDSIPTESFINGLMVLDQHNRGIDGRRAWTAGIEAMAQFVKNPNVFLDWIRAGDIFTLDAMVALVLDIRAGRCVDTQRINPSIWKLLSDGERLYTRLLLDRVDYPGLAAVHGDMSSK